MGVDYLVCKQCGETFPDCGPHVHCENCYEVNDDYTNWCCDGCAEYDGYKSEYCENYDENEEKCKLPNSKECFREDGNRDYADEYYCKIESCKYCRKEDYTDEQLLEFMLESYDINREEVVKLKRESEHNFEQISIKPKDTGKISDGYHTFNELYFHRMVLFSIICNQNKEKAWRSKLHHDGTMFDNYFIVGIETQEGQYSYHYNLECWQYFDDIKTLEKAPAWDGHKPEDITRLFSILKTELHPLIGPQCVNCDMFQNKTCVRKSIEKDDAFVCWMEEEY